MHHETLQVPLPQQQLQFPSFLVGNGHGGDCSADEDVVIRSFLNPSPHTADTSQCSNYPQRRRLMSGGLHSTWARTGTVIATCFHTDTSYSKDVVCLFGTTSRWPHTHTAGAAFDLVFASAAATSSHAGGRTFAFMTCWSQRSVERDFRMSNLSEDCALFSSHRLHFHHFALPSADSGDLGNTVSPACVRRTPRLAGAVCFRLPDSQCTPHALMGWRSPSRLCQTCDH